PVRLNPLDAPAGDHDPGRVAQRREQLLVSLAEAAIRRPLGPHETSACGVALRRATTDARVAVPVLPGVVRAMLWPHKDDARATATTVKGLAEEGRGVALALQRMVTGDLRGMFDAPTTPGVALEGPLAVVDLSELFRSDALGIVMVCATAWLQVTLARADGRKRIVVVDEAWAVLSRVGVARWLRESFKLSRSYGVQNIAVVHRLSDLSAVGRHGSETTAIAEGLLDDAQTRVLFNQPPGQVAVATDLIGLSDVEAQLLPALGKGEALWKVGERSFLVRHAVGAQEWALIDTDAAMVGDSE
ncbi:MAG: ATP-binding protein, partial [Actinomycetota bacterium]|nr:ATP-binding protein [Actinomycetota bacterium]